MAELVQEDRRRPCCRDDANLEAMPEAPPRNVTFTFGGQQGSGTETVRRCRVCGCRHFEVVAEPGHLQVIGKEGG